MNTLSVTIFIVIIGESGALKDMIEFNKELIRSSNLEKKSNELLSFTSLYILFIHLRSIYYLPSSY